GIYHYCLGSKYSISLSVKILYTVLFSNIPLVIHRKAIKSTIPLRSILTEVEYHTSIFIQQHAIIFFTILDCLFIPIDMEYRSQEPSSTGQIVYRRERDHQLHVYFLHGIIRIGPFKIKAYQLVYIVDTGGVS